MSRPIPEVLIADDPAATRTFALVHQGETLVVYEVLDDGERIDN